MSRQGDLVKVLTLIDESLSDLNSAAAQKQQITSLPASFSSTTYLNTLTRDLLEQQKQNATLLEENEVLRRRLHMQGGSTALVSNSTTDPTQYNDYTTTTTYKDALSTTIEMKLQMEIAVHATTATFVASTQIRLAITQ